MQQVRAPLVVLVVLKTGFGTVGFFVYVYLFVVLIYILRVSVVCPLVMLQSGASGHRWAVTSSPLHGEWWSSSTLYISTKALVMQVTSLESALSFILVWVQSVSFSDVNYLCRYLYHVDVPVPVTFVRVTVLSKVET